jgi:hypothetical protein
MTEDENGHVRVSEEAILKAMYVEDFFIKLLVFTERLNARIKQTTNGKDIS